MWVLTLDPVHSCSGLPRKVRTMHKDRTHPGFTAVLKAGDTLKGQGNVTSHVDGNEVRKHAAVIVDYALTCGLSACSRCTCMVNKSSTPISTMTS